MARAGIRCPVAIQRRLPACGLLAARKESQVWRVPVARHEAVQVVMIPRVLLRAQNVLNDVFVIVGSLARFSSERNGRDHREYDQDGEKRFLSHSFSRSQRRFWQRPSGAAGKT